MGTLSAINLQDYLVEPLCVFVLTDTYLSAIAGREIDSTPMTSATPQIIQENGEYSNIAQLPQG